MLQLQTRCISLQTGHTLLSKAICLKSCSCITADTYVFVSQGIDKGTCYLLLLFNRDCLYGGILSFSTEVPKLFVRLSKLTGKAAPSC